MTTKEKDQSRSDQPQPGSRDADPRGDLRTRILRAGWDASRNFNMVEEIEPRYLAAAREALIAAKERFECDVSCRAWMTDIIDDFLAELNRDADGH